MFAPSLVIATPLAAAGLTVIVGARVPRRVVQITSIVVAAIVLAGCFAMLGDVVAHGPRVEWVGGWHPGNRVGLGISLAVDLASACVAALVATSVFAAIVFSRQYVDDAGPIFYALLLAMLGAMIGFSYSADAFNIFVWYEVFSVAAYALATYHSEAESAYAGALQFALTNSVAGLLFLLGITLLEGRTGELGLVPIGHALAAEHRGDALVAVAFAFITIGLFTRGALAPLQFWFDEVHAAAPAPLSAILAGSMTPLALYAFARIYWSVFARAIAPSHALVGIVIAFGAVSAIYGSLMCLHESRLKRKLAHASVAHAGVAVALIGELTPRALAAAATYAATYATAAATLFFAIAILRNVTSEYDAKLLRGAGRTLRLTGVAFALGTTGFMALGSNVRVAATAGTAHAGVVVALLVAMTSMATGGAFLALFARIFVLAPRSVRVEVGEPPWYLLAPTLGLGVVSLAIGVTPSFLAIATQAAAGVVGRDVYARAVMLQQAFTVPAVQIPHTILATWLAPIGAIAVAIGILSKGKAIRRLRIAASRNAVYRFFYTINGGDSGSYISYIVGCAIVLAFSFMRSSGTAMP